MSPKSVGAKSGSPLITGVIFAALLCAIEGCTLGSRLRPDLAAPAISVIRIQPDRAWTDTGLVVQRGEQLFFTATGEILLAGRSKPAGPDGLKGYPGWSVGAGGLIGRVDGACGPAPAP